MTIEVIAEKRVDQGTGASRRLRRAGKVPAVVYGGNKDAAALTLDHNTIFYALKDESFHGAVLNLVVDGQTESVLLRDAQLHPFKPQVLHVDFQRIDANTPVLAKVALRFINADIAPAVKLNGKIIGYLLKSVNVRALPGKLPAALDVDLAKLQAGESVHLSDIVLPEGVEIDSLRRGNDLAVAKS